MSTFLLFVFDDIFHFLASISRRSCHRGPFSICLYSESFEIDVVANADKKNSEKNFLNVKMKQHQFLARKY